MLQIRFKILILILAVRLYAQEPLHSDWKNPSAWAPSSDPSTTNVTFTSDSTQFPGERILKLEYQHSNPNSWSNVEIPFESQGADTLLVSVPIVIELHSPTGKANLEIKLITPTDSTLLRVTGLNWNSDDGNTIVLYKKDFGYVWGGEASGNAFRFGLAVSGRDTGEVFIRRLEYGSQGAPSSFDPLWDNTCSERESTTMNPLDSRLVSWLRESLNNPTTGGEILVAMEDSNYSAYSNFLAAMAFTVLGDSANARKILDFFALRMDRNHPEQFFYDANGNAIGIPQTTRYNGTGYSYEENRYLGDALFGVMAFVLFDSIFSTNLYSDAVSKIKELADSLYVDESDSTGYVMNGWIGSDSLDSNAIVEANIDVVSLLTHFDESIRADKIKNWINQTNRGKTEVHADNFLWRFMSYDGTDTSLISKVACDKRYWKTDVEFNGKPVSGVYDYPSIFIKNIFPEAVAQLSIAYGMSGDIRKANYYANLLDTYFIPRDTMLTIPHTLNRYGNHLWVDTDKGMVSTVAWAILAKKQVNPFAFEYTGTGISTGKSAVKNGSALKVKIQGNNVYYYRMNNGKQEVYKLNGKHLERIK